MKRIDVLLEDLEIESGLNLKLDYSTQYGGYRLIKEDGTGAFGYSSHDTRISGDKMQTRLIGVIFGIRFGKTMQK